MTFRNLSNNLRNKLTQYQAFPTIVIDVFLSTVKEHWDNEQIIDIITGSFGISDIIDKNLQDEVEKLKNEL